ncbi:hypothetical protein HK100_008955 [Physocladia obscura]|uniref:Uncharacterized protein n=1 Tax=Physocladia obscura TaxID=109957 RepID=A0AAD5SPZ6_9FUNG|nr:hypothetical protein HK100_008955 [Physocladia obscura]
MTDRYCNVKYKTVDVGIKITALMTRIADVQQPVKDALSLDGGYGLIQIYDRDNKLITDLEDIPNIYYEREPSSTSRFNDPDSTEGPTSKKQRFDDRLLSDLTTKFKAFADRDSSGAFLPDNTNSTNEPASKKQRIDDGLLFDLTTKFKTFVEGAQLVHTCICTEALSFLPYPQDEFRKLFVKKCYQDVYGLMVTQVEAGIEAFAISGTPGVGKSLFFVYILYRLVTDQSINTSRSDPTSSAFRASSSQPFTFEASSSSLRPGSVSPLDFKPTKILYQTGSTYESFDMNHCAVAGVTKIEAERLVREAETFYIIDGRDSPPLPSSCVVLFIALPRSDTYKEFVKQKMASEWFFPVWTLQELKICRLNCYSNLKINMLEERYRICGGVAHYVFHRDFSISITKKMRAVLSDVNAVCGVKYVGELSNIFPQSHALMHMLIGNYHEGNPYQFIGLDVTSKYVREQL